MEAFKIEPRYEAIRITNHEKIVGSIGKTEYNYLESTGSVFEFIQVMGLGMEKILISVTTPFLSDTGVPQLILKRTDGSTLPLYGTVYLRRFKNITSLETSDFIKKLSNLLDKDVIMFNGVKLHYLTILDN